MVTKYQNLTEDDIYNIKRFYCAMYKEEALDKKETTFILEYRQKLYEAILNLWEAFDKNNEETKSLGLNQICEVSKMIECYMKEATSGNIRQRMLFINNLKKEIETINTAIQWGLHKYSLENAIHMQNSANDLCNFLKFAGVKSLNENHNINQMLEENSKMQVKSLRKKLKKKFLDFIDLDNLSFYDNYFVIGESLNAIEEIKEEENKLEKIKCGECKIDDCMISHCNTFKRKLELEGIIKEHQKVIDICGARLQGKVVDFEDLEKLNEKYIDKKVLKALATLIGIPPIETRTDRIKKIDIEDLTRMPELIDSEAVKSLLANFDTIPPDKKYYEDIKLITSSLLLTRCDYSEAKGNQELEKFFKWCEQVGKNFEQESKPVSYAGKLLKMYEQNKKEVGKGE